MDSWPVKEREQQYLHIPKAGESPPSFGRDLQTQGRQSRVTKHVTHFNAWRVAGVVGGGDPAQVGSHVLSAENTPPVLTQGALIEQPRC
jgi:hypothetical protein